MVHERQPLHETTISYFYKLLLEVTISQIVLHNPKIFQKITEGISYWNRMPD